MAQAMQCDGPDDTGASFVLTNIDEADTKALCLSCMADFAQAFLSIVDPSRLAPPPAPRPRKSRQKATAAVADDSQGGASDGDTSASGNGQAARVGQD